MLAIKFSTQVVFAVRFFTLNGRLTKTVLFQDRWPLMAVVFQGRFHLYSVQIGESLLMFMSVIFHCLVVHIHSVAWAVTCGCHCPRSHDRPFDPTAAVSVYLLSILQY